MLKSVWQQVLTFVRSTGATAGETRPAVRRAVSCMAGCDCVTAQNGGSGGTHGEASGTSRKGMVPLPDFTLSGNIVF